jgi:hypothetical protein
LALPRSFDQAALMMLADDFAPFDALSEPHLQFRGPELLARPDYWAPRRGLFLS